MSVYKPIYPNKESEQHAFCHYLTMTSKSLHYWDENTQSIKHGIPKKNKNRDLGMIIYCNYLTTTEKSIYHWNVEKQIVEYYCKNEQKNLNINNYWENFKLMLFGGIIGSLIIYIPISIYKLINYYY